MCAGSTIVFQIMKGSSKPAKSDKKVAKSAADKSNKVKSDYQAGKDRKEAVIPAAGKKK